MRRLFVTSILALTCQLLGCATAPGKVKEVGNSGTPASAEPVAAGSILGPIGADSTDWIQVHTEQAPYSDLVRRGLAPARAEGASTPTQLVFYRPKAPSTAEYRLVWQLVQNGTVWSQLSAPRVWTLDPFNSGSDRVEADVSEPFPNFGTSTTFMLKGLTLNKPIKFFLGRVTASTGALPTHWLPLGEVTPTGGVVNIPVLIKEDMGTFSDGTSARFEKGFYYELGYSFEGMSYPTSIKGCPDGFYIPNS